jgi:hypothetical protein
VAGDERSYDTFAMLANVRNGRGFAGIKTSDGFPFIAEPRGLPDDFEMVERKTRDEEDDGEDERHPERWEVGGGEHHLMPIGTPSGDTFEWAEKEYRERRLNEKSLECVVWMGDHSHSWLLGSEINAFIKEHSQAITTKCGVADASLWEKELEGKPPCQPSDWSGAVSGRLVRNVSADHYVFLRDSGQLEKGASYYIPVEWQASVADAGMIRQVSEELNRLAEKYGVTPDNVRMVFGFDS